jgi:hypothetical protein
LFAACKKKLLKRRRNRRPAPAHHADPGGADGDALFSNARFSVAGSLLVRCLLLGVNSFVCSDARKTAKTAGEIGALSPPFSQTSLISVVAD